LQNFNITLRTIAAQPQIVEDYITTFQLIGMKPLRGKPIEAPLPQSFSFFLAFVAVVVFHSCIFRKKIKTLLPAYLEGEFNQGLCLRQILFLATYCNFQVLTA